MLSRALPAALVIALLAAVPASAAVLWPPRGKTFFGVSDRGTVAEFTEFAEFVGKHPALLQTFHPWGNSLGQAHPRWAATRTRPILHISTVDDQTLEELITPRAIARGFGDNYLLRLNRFFATQDLRAYVRPLGEPNRCLNAWSAVTCSGLRRGGAHSHYFYRAAFRRISIIVRGDGTLAQVNRRLRRASLRRLERRGGPEPRVLPEAPVAIVWSPLPGGSPRVRGNFPGNYWPGRRYVDWVGSDIYSEYPVWRDLRRFYGNRRWGRKPFALTEFAVAGRDDPQFMRRVFGWARQRRRVRMLVYYRGFGEAGNSYRTGLYPRSAAVLRHRLRQRRFPSFAQTYARPPERPRGARVPSRVDSTSAAPRG